LRFEIKRIGLKNLKFGNTGVANCADGQKLSIANSKFVEFASVRWLYKGAFPESQRPLGNETELYPEEFRSFPTMTMTDPIADMLTRMRNALRIGRNKVTIPRSKIKVGIAEVLKREGYIKNFNIDETGPQGTITVDLKYGPNGEQVISSIRRVSKPGRRLYSTVEDLNPVLNGLGINVLSTSKGVLSDREARKKSVGGELLCEIY
jgi:small subunit ribosomal protein S8